LFIVVKQPQPTYRMILGACIPDEVIHRHRQKVQPLKNDIFIFRDYEIVSLGSAGDVAQPPPVADEGCGGVVNRNEQCERQRAMRRLRLRNARGECGACIPYAFCRPWRLRHRQKVQPLKTTKSFY